VENSVVTKLISFVSETIVKIKVLDFNEICTFHIPVHLYDVFFLFEKIDSFA
jgi:hypothetical protein